MSGRIRVPAGIPPGPLRPVAAFFDILMTEVGLRGTFGGKRRLQIRENRPGLQPSAFGRGALAGVKWVKSSLIKVNQGGFRQEHWRMGDFILSSPFVLSCLPYSKSPRAAIAKSR